MKAELQQLQQKSKQIYVRVTAYLLRGAHIDIPLWQHHVRHLQDSAS
jgi:hypothetical protein